MDEAGVVVVGGGPGGLAVVRAYREAGGSRPVRLLTAEGRGPYFRPHLSKEYLRGELDAADLPLEPPGWYDEHGVDLVLGAEVIAVDPVSRTVTVRGAGPVTYSALVLATGSEPRRLPLPGGDDPGLLLLRSVDDSDRIAGAARPGARVVVVGSGFIGCEAAASLARRGADVTLVSPEPVPQAQRLGEAAGEQLRDWLAAEGVALRLGTQVAAFAGAGRVDLQDAPPISADAVVCATGVAPRTGLAEAAGIALDGGGIATDAGMRSATAGVWAVGDVAFARNTAAGRPLRVEHWGEAERQGRVAGRTLAGEDAAWDAAPGFWSQIGDRTLKYVAWGDGFDEARFEGDPRAWTVWYGRGGTTVGVLTHDRDADHELGRDLVERGAPLP